MRSTHYVFYDFITKYTEFFCEKMIQAFAMQKLLTIFPTKNIGVFHISMFRILTKR